MFLKEKYLLSGWGGGGSRTREHCAEAPHVERVVILAKANENYCINAKGRASKKYLFLDEGGCEARIGTGPSRVRIEEIKSSVFRVGGARTCEHCAEAPHVERVVILAEVDQQLRALRFWV